MSHEEPTTGERDVDRPRLLGRARCGIDCGLTCIRPAHGRPTPPAGRPLVAHRFPGGQGRPRRRGSAGPRSDRRSAAGPAGRKRLGGGSPERTPNPK